jgi:hypothetical protein
MLAVISCALVIGVLMLVNIPAMQTIFAPTAPTMLDRR